MIENKTLTKLTFQQNSTTTKTHKNSDTFYPTQQNKKTIGTNQKRICVLIIRSLNCDKHWYTDIATRCTRRIDSQYFKASLELLIKRNIIIRTHAGYFELAPTWKKELKKIGITCMRDTP